MCLTGCVLASVWICLNVSSSSGVKWCCGVGSVFRVCFEAISEEAVSHCMLLGHLSVLWWASSWKLSRKDIINKTERSRILQQAGNNIKVCKQLLAHHCFPTQEALATSGWKDLNCDPAQGWPFKVLSAVQFYVTYTSLIRLFMWRLTL